MKDNQMSENQYLDEVYSDDQADQVEEHLRELSYQDMSGGFNEDELTFMLSDDTRFDWLLKSDFCTIRAWLDMGKAIYAPSTPDTHPCGACAAAHPKTWTWNSTEIYNNLVQRLHDTAAQREKENRSKKDLEFFYGYAVALLDYGIITDAQYRTARDYCVYLMRRGVKVDQLRIPLNSV